MNFIEFLQSDAVITQTGKIRSSVVKDINKSNEALAALEQHTSFLQLNPGTSQRIKAIRLNVTEHPICPVCKSDFVLYDPIKRPHVMFSSSCSAKCAAINPLKFAKARKTSRERYGCDYHQNTTEGKQVRENTNLEKWGMKSPAAHPTVRDQIKKTNLERYGHENVFGSKYGKQKLRQTNLKKYGSTSYQTSTISPFAKALLEDREWLHNKNVRDGKTLENIAAMLGVSVACVHQHFKSHTLPVHRQHRSSFEKSVSDLLSENEIDHVPNLTIDGTEFDIVIPNNRICIECNGIYWHGELRGRGESYHLNKSLTGEQSGYRVFHIFEDQWQLNHKIIKNNLFKAVGVCTHLDAYDCIIEYMHPSDAKLFMSKYHAMGYVGDSNHISFVALRDDERDPVVVVAVSTCEQKVCQILRIAEVFGTTVHNTVDVLVEFLLNSKRADSVELFADRGWGNGHVECSRSAEISVIAPSCRYFKTNNCLQLLSSHEFLRDNSTVPIEKGDNNSSMWATAINNGYDRVWDCGWLKWVFKKESSADDSF